MISGDSSTKYCLGGSTPQTKKIAVICCYFNGNEFIEQQLNSIFSQSHKAFHVFLSDDGSSNSFDISDFKFEPADLNKLSVRKNEKTLGFSKNFLSTLANISRDFDYYAFSDQDDIWHEDKLKRAYDVLGGLNSETPALYCGRTEVCDSTINKSLGFSPLFKKPPSFENSLTQNIGGGNTMVFNRAARDIIVQSSLDTNLVSHDWWCYQIIAGTGGVVYYDEVSFLKYRQHEKNVVGANNNWRARAKRIGKLLNGEFRIWCDINLEALSKNRQLLTTKNQLILDDVKKARSSFIIKRARLFKKSGIYRQTLMGNVGLWVGILLNKV